MKQLRNCSKEFTFWSFLSHTLSLYRNFLHFIFGNLFTQFDTLLSHFHFQSIDAAVYIGFCVQNTVHEIHFILFTVCRIQLRKCLSFVQMNTMRNKRVCTRKTVFNIETLCVSIKLTIFIFYFSRSFVRKQMKSYIQCWSLFDSLLSFTVRSLTISHIVRK